MTGSNLYAAMKQRFPADLDTPFLQTADGATLSYGALDQDTARVAGLLKSLGVTPGERVVVQVEKSVANVVLYLGCLRAGAIYVPLNTAYTTQEVSYFLGDANPGLLVCDPQRESELTIVAEAVSVDHVLTLDPTGQGSFEKALEEATPNDEIWACNADDLAAICYTSGTTGRSKGAMLSHGNLLSNAETLVELWGFTADDILVHALPIYHVHGLFVALHCVLLSGSRAWFLPKFDADEILRLIPQSTVMMGVPTFYTRLLDHPELNAELCTSMRLFISGSAPLLVDTFEAFEQRTDHKILERYGMTEAGMITSNPLDGDRVQGSVGFALSGVDARVAAEDGKICAPGEIGVLEFKGPNLFKGYWQMPDKTREEFRDDGYFITGDVAMMDAQGRVSIVGRAKDLIISGGFNVYPKEVELVIDELEGVLESAVIGVPHPDFGEGVVAVVVPEVGSAPKEGDLLAAISDQLARFKQPKRLIFVEALPRNAMGKVQKNVLREKYTSLFA